MDQTVNKSETYRSYLRSVLQLFSFLDEHQFDSDEADELREEMVSLWYSLSSIEKARMDGMAMDLYYIREAERSLELSTDLGKDQLTAAANLSNQGEPDEALELLRKTQDGIYPPALSFMRGRIWLEMDVPEVAAEFLRDARQLDQTRLLFRQQA